MMKGIIVIIVGLLLGLVDIAAAQMTVVKGSLHGQKGRISIAPNTGFSRPLKVGEIAADGRFCLEMEIPAAGFYFLNGENDRYMLFLNPGDELEVTMGESLCEIGGKGWIEENRFLLKNRKISEEYYSLPVPVRTSFCKERSEGAWKNYQAKLEALEGIPLCGEFKDMYKGIAAVEYWMNMTGGLGYKGDEQLEPEYYDAVVRVPWSSNMLSDGRWFEILERWFTYNMRVGKLRLTTYENRLKDLASFVKDKDVREAYLMEQIRLEVLRGEFVGLPEAVDKVRKWIRRPENRIELEKQMELMKKNYAAYAGCLPGTDCSAFEFSDREGKPVKLGDLKGKYVYIDVWSTGCLPCKMEIPFLKQLEKAMEGQDIVFVSVSLDTKEEVWLKFIREKEMNGVQWIAGEGFKHPFCRAMGINGIPQFILLDKDSKVINFNAKRPSNPILWNYLKKIVGK